MFLGEAGFSAKPLARATIWPHKIAYYAERRDAEFEPKMVQVVRVYREVWLFRTQKRSGQRATVIPSYDKKRGIQAIKSKGPDLPEVPGRHPVILRNYQYERLGTVSVLTPIDLLTGHIPGQVRDRHRSQEFIERLQSLDQFYSRHVKIELILGNHSAHTAKQTQQYRKTVPNCFEFISTPTHGSSLNRIETFFRKMVGPVSRGIRVELIQEMKERLEQYFREVNEMPRIYKWRYWLDETLSTSSTAVQ